MRPVSDKHIIRPGLSGTGPARCYILRRIRGVLSTILIGALLPALVPAALGQLQTRYEGLTFTLLTEDSLAPAANTPLPELSLEDMRALSESLQALRDTLEESFGPFEEGQLQPVTDMATQLKAAGRHEQALEELDKALQITRIHNGLNSPEQIPIIDGMIESHLAQENYDAADDLESLALHVITQAYPDNADTRSAAITRHADWNISWFQNNYLYLHQEASLNPGDSIRFRTNPFNSGGPLSNSMLAGDGLFGNPSSLTSVGPPPISISSSRYITPYSRRLNTAEDNFASVLRDKNASPAARMQALDRLLTILWLRNQELYLYRRYISFNHSAVISYRDAQMMETRHYREGLALLEAKLTLVESDDSATTADVASIRLDIADWHLAFTRESQGHKAYREAWQYLLDNGYSEDDANGLMNSPQYLMLPAFVTHQFSETWAKEFEEVSGEVVIELDIREDGLTTRLRVEEHDDEARLPLRHILRNFLKDATFRPLLVDGEAVRQKDILLRYRFHY